MSRLWTHWDWLIWVNAHIQIDTHTHSQCAHENGEAREREDKENGCIGVSGRGGGDIKRDPKMCVYYTLIIIIKKIVLHHLKL